MLTVIYFQERFLDSQQTGYSTISNLLNTYFITDIGNIIMTYINPPIQICVCNKCNLKISSKSYINIISLENKYTGLFCDGDILFCTGCLKKYKSMLSRESSIVRSIYSFEKDLQNEWSKFYSKKIFSKINRFENSDIFQIDMKQ